MAGGNFTGCQNPKDNRARSEGEPNPGTSKIPVTQETVIIPSLTSFYSFKQSALTQMKMMQNACVFMRP